MQKEQTKAKIKKLEDLLQELNLSLKAVLIPSESALSAKLIVVDNEQYPEEPKKEEPKVEESTETATA